jgi:hypothetical protein
MLVKNFQQHALGRHLHGARERVSQCNGNRRGNHQDGCHVFGPGTALETRQRPPKGYDSADFLARWILH